jgi:hypothetical protein
LSVEKPKKEETKLNIKDVVHDLVVTAHATSFSKKQLIEDIKSRFGDLKKTHVEAFVKECFDKKKQPLDSKVRLYRYLFLLGSSICPGRGFRKIWSFRIFTLGSSKNL